jgi:hypothetical protein
MTGRSRASSDRSDRSDGSDGSDGFAAIAASAHLNACQTPYDSGGFFDFYRTVAEWIDEVARLASGVSDPSDGSILLSVSVRVRLRFDALSSTTSKPILRRTGDANRNLLPIALASLGHVFQPEGAASDRSRLFNSCNNSAMVPPHSRRSIMNAATATTTASFSATDSFASSAALSKALIKTPNGKASVATDQRAKSAIRGICRSFT